MYPNFRHKVLSNFPFSLPAPNILVIMTDQQRWDSLGCYGCQAIGTPNLDRLAGQGIRFEHCYAANPICTPSRASLMTGKPVPAHGVARLYDVLSPEQPLFPLYLKQQGYHTALFGKLHVSAIRHELEHRRDNDGFDTYEWCPEPSLLLEHPSQAYGRWLEKNHPEFYSRLLENGRLLRDVPQECHMTHWAASRTIDYIRNRERLSPFFCMMSVFDPHNPYHDYPEKFRTRVDAAKISPPIQDSMPMHVMPEAIRREHDHGYMLAGNKKGPAWGNGNSTISPADSRQTHSDIEAFYAPDRILQDQVDYLASIALLDDEVGRVLDVLDAEGIADDTLVIFCSDHGDMLGDHGLLGKGAYFYDPCIRVPLILRWPRLQQVAGNKGQLQHAPVQLHDLTSTILQAAGIDAEFVNSIMPDSRNLLAGTSCVSENGSPFRDYVVSVYCGTGICDTGKYFDPPIHGAMIRNYRYKLCVYHPADNVTRMFDGQLFDMQEDPHETKNLWDSPSHAEIRHQLEEALLAWHEADSTSSATLSV